MRLEKRDLKKNDHTQPSQKEEWLLDSLLNNYLTNLFCFN